MNKVYTAQEVADKLKIKKSTVYDLIKRGELPAVRMGRTIRIPESAFRATANTAPEKRETPDKRPVILKIRP